MCPFEAQGIRDNTIINVQLSEDPIERLTVARESFALFHKTPTSPGLRFILPDSVLLGASKNDHLVRALLPYQAELCAAELDCRLYPLLSYHHRTTNINPLDLMQMLFGNFVLTTVSFLVDQVITNIAETDIGGMYDLAQLIKNFFEKLIDQGMEFPRIVIFYPETEVEAVVISNSGIVFSIEREPQHQHNNQNCFSVVKTPFYPTSFGRYSSKVEIVFSREADFVKLSDDARGKIRRQSNTVLKEHGIPILDLDKDKVECSGLWNINLLEWT
jgi:hypothetical protein